MRNFIVYMCTDQKNGVTFGNKPLSNDSAVWEDLLRDSEFILSGIEMDNRSIARLEQYLRVKENLEGSDTPVPYIHNNILDKKFAVEEADSDEDTETEDFPMDAEEAVFLEYENGERFIDLPDSVILYRWDKVYPSDKKLHLDLSHYNLIEKIPLRGTSHEEIMKEIYVKKTAESA